jgi:hypothetical protein
MNPFSKRIAAESPAATRKTVSSISHLVMKTALNPNVLNHNRSTKKRLKVAAPTMSAMINAASMRDPLFISVMFLPIASYIYRITREEGTGFSSNLLKNPVPFGLLKKSESRGA